MLSPMVVQYLVGLCCARGNPSAVDVTIGDMVYDSLAEKTRDVDVTVTMAKEGDVSGYLAYEVKHEHAPLDLPVVEGLCAKLTDMKQLSSRAIVSTSSYTPAAMRKAAAWGIELFTLRRWSEPVGQLLPAFAEVVKTPDEFFEISQALLQWHDDYSFLHVPDADPFTWGPDTPLYTAKGKTHPRYKSMQMLMPAIKLRSTKALLNVPPASGHLGTNFDDIAPWPFAHTLDVISDKLYMKCGTKLLPIVSWTISGQLQWDKFENVGHYYIMQSADGASLFSAAAIGGGAPGDRMVALLFVPDSREVTVTSFELLDKHKNAIRNLKLDLPAKQL